MLPSLFVSHGSPMLVFEKEPASDFLRDVSATLPVRPRGIVVISAHWETTRPVVMTTPHPETIHDFAGFPKELYELHYRAAGDAELSNRIVTLLNAAGIDTDTDHHRGLDHGAWNPLMLMYPAADIPVVQLSVQPHHDARWHYEMGKAIAPLREDNILILGSGNLTHNLREAFRAHHDAPPSWVTEFSQWIATHVSSGNINSLLHWASAPHALKNHPTPEHILPFFVAMGAGGTPLHAQRLHDSIDLGVLAMDAYSFGTQA